MKEIYHHNKLLFPSQLKQKSLWQKYSTHGKLKIKSDLRNKKIVPSEDRRYYKKNLTLIWSLISPQENQNSILT
jgi:hypothetical protein